MAMESGFCSTDKAYSVYMHTAPNGKKYIGITCRVPAYRWGKNGERYKQCVAFYSAIKKYGWENIKHEILFSGMSKADAENMEISLIEKYGTTKRTKGYNLMTGGGVRSVHSLETKKKMSASGKGRIVTPETRAKISASTIGKTLPEETRIKISIAKTGTKFTAQQRENMSKARKGVPLTPEHREKISKANKGRALTEAHRSKISAARIGIVYSDETKAKIGAASKGRVQSAEARAKNSKANMGNQNARKKEKTQSGKDCVEKTSE